MEYVVTDKKCNHHYVEAESRKDAEEKAKLGGIDVAMVIAGRKDLSEYLKGK